MKRRGFFRPVWHLGIKEMRSLFRDPMLFGFMIFAFTVGVYSAGKGSSIDVRDAAVAVVDQDQSPLSQRVISAIHPPEFKDPVVISQDELIPVMDKGDFTFVLVFPPGFQRDVLAGRVPELQLNVDATQMSQSFTGSAHLAALISRAVTIHTQRRLVDSALPVNLVTRMRFNQTLNSEWFGSVMELVNVLTMLSVILTGASMIREREHGTLGHLLVMPLTPLQLLLARLWSMGLVVLVAGMLSLRLVISGGLAMPVAGSYGLFMLATALHLFATTSMGVLLATVARNMPQLGLMAMLVIMPMTLLSGGTTPYETMPQLVQWLMNLAPTTHFVAVAQAVLYRGAGLDVVAGHLLALSLIGLGFCLISLSRFRRSLAAA
ncbi:ABC transporter permease [Granulosicoccaceae sp. 1_MG-2023]|nr:ABC transporter permease [Granulosicoccaceae sp. 1_MG-2023]